MDLFYKLQLDTIFNAVASIYGGALSPEIYTDKDPINAKVPDRESFRALYEEPVTNVGSLIEWIARNVPSAQDVLERVKVGFVCNPTQTAFITKSGDYYVIGVCSGLVDAIARAANTLLSNSDTFPSIGQPAQEVRRRYHGTLLEDPIDVVQAASTGFGLGPIIPGNSMISEYAFPVWPRPLDPNRNEAAHLMTIFAVEFCFLHELGHLLCGHFGLLPDRMALISDGVVTKVSGIPDDTSHFMEFDADATAVQLAGGGGLIAPLKWRKPTYNNYLRDASFLDFIHDEDRHEDAGLLDRNALSYQWASATTIVMYLFAQCDISTTDWVSKEHPHPLLRTMNLANTIEATRMRNDPIYEIAASQWPSAFRDVHFAWTNRGVPGTRSLAFDVDDKDRIIELMNAQNRVNAQFWSQMQSRKMRSLGNAICERLLRQAPDGFSGMGPNDKGQ